MATIKAERRRVGLLLLALAVASLGLVGCSKGNVFSLKVGDCFSGASSGDELSDVGKVNCSKAHENEVYAKFDLSGSTWPGEYEVGRLGHQGCLGRFRSYVGIDYASSIYVVGQLLPTKDSWNRSDDREVVCVLGPRYGTKTGSARGTQR